jgi:hypothetical protein
MTGVFATARLTLVTVLTIFLGRLTVICEARFTAFFTLRGFLTGRFAETAAGFALGLAVRSFGAFRARAFPAGERLVAGLRRVDLPATTRLRDAAAADEWREEGRDVSFFALLAMGLLMRKALDSKTIHHKDRRKKQGESLT